MSKLEQSKIEQQTLAYWRSEDAFAKSDKFRNGAPFITYDGPPFATGTPHFGHILVSVIKDTVCRYQSMTGHPVPRKFGWDCHGLPIESIAQKELNTTAAEIIRDGKVAEFNDKCRSLVSRCEGDWKTVIERIGRWVDFKNPYRTMDKSYMESVWWAFKQLYLKDKIYKAHRIMAYSGKLMTPLSNFEVSDNYREVEDYYVIAKFKSTYAGTQFSILAYTTTPWTLPSNSALCVHPEHEYSVVEDILTAQKFLITPKCIAKVFTKRSYRILFTRKGKELEGLYYEPLFDVSGSVSGKQLPDYRIVCDPFVSDEDGTGIVHIAPSFGEDDYRIGKKNQLPMLDFLDEECKFTDKHAAVKQYAGLFCKAADEKILGELNEQGKLFSYGKVKHSYPFCDRTDSPIIYRAIDAWYVSIENDKKALLANNAKIKWVPDHVGSNRFANWLKDCKDWNISRNRLWGSCIPLWVEENGNDTICIGSIEELEELSGVKITDLHKDHLDKIVIERNGRTYRRVPEVLDCWFESGAMPFAQYHYPFENEDLFNETFPADFVVEGLDQTRGWFYTLLVLSTLLFDAPPFKNVIVNGLILAEDGSKMSKSKNNYADPMTLIDKHGADALRMYLCGSVATRAEPFSFSEKDLETVSKAVISPFLNACDFYRMYAGKDKPTSAWKVRRKLDSWLLAKYNKLVIEVRDSMDKYELWRVAPKVSEFMDDLCNWYIRLSRKVFSGNGDNYTKDAAKNTLHSVLVGLSRLLAPFIPFTADFVYDIMDKDGSVHWQTYPARENSQYDDKLIAEMDEVRHVANLARRVRAKNNIKTRQPLRQMTVFGSKIGIEYIDLLNSELNVQFVDLKSYDDVPKTLVCKPNQRALGQKFGIKAVPIAHAIAALSQDAVAKLHAGTSVCIPSGEMTGMFITKDYVLITQQLEFGGAFMSDNGITVSLDTKLDDKLLELGFIAEFRSMVQNIRKTAGLNINDLVFMELFAGQEVLKSIGNHKNSLCSHLMASDIELFLPEKVDMDNAHQLKIDNEVFFMKIYREHSSPAANNG